MCAAIRNNGLAFPRKRLKVSRAPVELRNEGSGLDLATTQSTLSLRPNDWRPIQYTVHLICSE